MSGIEENHKSAEQPLVGQNVLVTGATGGIGMSLAESLHACGARPIIHYSNNETSARALLDGVSGKGWIARPIFPARAARSNCGRAPSARRAACTRWSTTQASVLK